MHLRGNIVLCSHDKEIVAIANIWNLSKVSQLIRKKAETRIQIFINHCLFYIIRPHFNMT